MINCELLLGEMEAIGVRKVAHDWFSSYLRNDHQFVVILYSNGDGYFERHASSRVLIKRGVPKGSVLGPKWFLLL